jgi:prophage regulatory protein
VTTAKQDEKRAPSQPIEVAAVPGSMLRIATVTAVTGLSRATIYRMMLKGEFPKAVQLSKHCVAWKQADVADWVAGRSGRA